MTPLKTLPKKLRLLRCFGVSAVQSRQQSRGKDLVTSSGEVQDCNEPMFAPLTALLIHRLLNVACWA